MQHELKERERDRTYRRHEANDHEPLEDPDEKPMHGAIEASHDLFPDNHSQPLEYVDACGPGPQYYLVVHVRGQRALCQHLRSGTVVHRDGVDGILERVAQRLWYQRDDR